MKTEKLCSICRIPIHKNYCGNCGQLYSGKNVSTLSLITDFISNFLSVEKSGFATIFKVIQNPKPIVTNYYKGFKNYYASPGKIILYGIAAITLHFLFVQEKVLGLSLLTENISSQYLFWGLLLPILSIISYLSFLPKKVAFSKNLIAIGYNSSSIFILFLLLLDTIEWIFKIDVGVSAFLSYLGFVFLWNGRAHIKKNKYFELLIFTVFQIILFTIIVAVLINTTNKLNNQ